MKNVLYLRLRGSSRVLLHHSEHEMLPLKMHEKKHERPDAKFVSEIRTLMLGKKIFNLI